MSSTEAAIARARRLDAEWTRQSMLVACGYESAAERADALHAELLGIRREHPSLTLADIRPPSLELTGEELTREHRGW